MMVREMTAAISFVVLVFVYGAYSLWLMAGPHTAGETLGVLIAGIVLTVIVTTIVAIVVAVPWGIYASLRGARNEAADERDREIARTSMRNAYLVVIVFIWVVPFLALAGSAVLAANVALLTMGVAEIVNYGSRLYYYRWGA
jgi:hypothetical protein